METINQKLTPLYVQYEAIQAQEKMVNSPNHTEVFVPVGPMGVPMVGTMKLGAGGWAIANYPLGALGFVCSIDFGGRMKRSVRGGPAARQAPSAERDERPRRWWQTLEAGSPEDAKCFPACIGAIGIGALTDCRIFAALGFSLDQNAR